MNTDREKMWEAVHPLDNIFWRVETHTAIEKLIFFYESLGSQATQLEASYHRSKLFKEDCPLCVSANNPGGCSEMTICALCPWVVFEQRTCMGGGYFYTPVKDRLTRLYKWKEHLMTEYPFPITTYPDFRRVK